MYECVSQRLLVEACVYNNNDIPRYWDLMMVQRFKAYAYLPNFLLPEKVKVMEVWEAKEKIISFVFGSMETFESVYEIILLIYCV